MKILRLPRPMRALLARYCRGVMHARAPDRLVRDGAGRAYLARWYVGGERGRDRAARGLPCAYIHGFYASDGPVLHDHPWASASLIVAGCYIEEVPAPGQPPNGARRRLPRRAGDVTVRAPSSPHRIELPAAMPMPVVSLFLVGRRRRRWGFWCPRGWRDGALAKRRERLGRSPGAGCE